MACKWTYPAGLTAMCEAARKRAHGCVSVALGRPPKEPSRCQVVLRKGEKQFGALWGWYDRYWKFYVGGLCYGTKIEVGCNPKTGGEVSDSVLAHEMAHVYIIASTRDWGHPTRFSVCFWGAPAKAGRAVRAVWRALRGARRHGDGLGR